VKNSCDYAENPLDPEKECGEPATKFFRGTLFGRTIRTFARCPTHGKLQFLSPHADKPRYLKFLGQWVKVEELSEAEFLVAQVMDA